MFILVVTKQIGGKHLKSATGVIDYTSETVGDNAKIYEQELRFDIDSDGEIWSPAKLNFQQVTTDNVGAKAFLDSDNNLYIQAANSAQKKAVTDNGALTRFDLPRKSDEA